MPVWASSGAPREPLPGSVTLCAASGLCGALQAGALREDSPVLREVSDLPGHIQHRRRALLGSRPGEPGLVSPRGV